MKGEMHVSYTVEEEEIDWIVEMAQRLGDPIPREIVPQFLQLSGEFEQHKGRAVI